MGIVTRMLRLCRADLHGVMDQLEDKGLLLRQYLREMEQSLQAKQEAMERLGLTERDLRRSLADREKEAQRLEGEIAPVLRRGQEEIARALIRRRRGLEACCLQLRQRIAGLAEEQGRLGALLERQRLERDELVTRVALYHQAQEQRRFDEGPTASGEDGLWRAASEEEIEWELVQRKEALARGGAS
jgi:phage shock protein A